MIINEMEIIFYYYFTLFQVRQNIKKIKMSKNTLKRPEYVEKMAFRKTKLPFSLNIRYSQ